VKIEYYLSRAWDGPVRSRNQKDLEDIPEAARNQLNFVWIERVEDALLAALST